MSRISSQIGDSSDGEDYDEINSDEKDRNKKYLERLYKNGENEEYSASWILKELGNQLLQSKKVRDQYQIIKTQFTESLNEDEKKRFEYLDKEIGRSNLYAIMKSYKCDGNVGNTDYYKITKSEIEKTCGQETKYKALETDIEKLNYYLNKKVTYYLNFEEINVLNKKVYKDKTNQKSTELKIENQLDDASLFLAKVKGSKKLDRDLGKIALYDGLHGNKKGKRLNEQGLISKEETQDYETLSIYDSGSFKCFVEGVGKYSKFDNKYLKPTKEYLNNNPKNSWKKIIKKYLRGSNSFPPFPSYLQLIIQLIFGVEVKRNSATLITAPMFFELVDEEAKETRKGKVKETKEAKKYKIENIATKFPMAMEGAVKASIGMDLTSDYGARNQYDYRDRVNDPKEALCNSLNKRDYQILKDWLIEYHDLKYESNYLIVPREYFNNLIEDWYGINLAHLNSDEIIKIELKPEEELDKSVEEPEDSDLDELVNKTAEIQID